MQANSRVVDSVSPVPGSVGAPFPQLVGEDLLALLNRHHNVVDMQVPIGTKIRMSNGDEFCYMQMTGGAAALGQLVAQMADTAAAGTDTVSSSADLLSIETITGLTAGAHYGDMVTVDDGTGEGQTRWITGSTAIKLNLDRPLLTALAVGTSDITIVRPYRVLLLPLAAEGSQRIPSAVAIGAVTQNYYGWFQTGGICQHVRVTATTVAVNDLLTGDVSGGAAGTAKTMSGIISYHLIFGRSLGAAANLVADTGTVPVSLGKLF